MTEESTQLAPAPTNASPTISTDSCDDHATSGSAPPATTIPTQMITMRLCFSPSAPTAGAASPYASDAAGRAHACAVGTRSAAIAHARTGHEDHARERLRHADRVLHVRRDKRLQRGDGRVAEHEGHEQQPHLTVAQRRPARQVPLRRGHERRGRERGLQRRAGQQTGGDEHERQRAAQGRGDEGEAAEGRAHQHAQRWRHTLWVHAERKQRTRARAHPRRPWRCRALGRARRRET